MTVAEIIQEQSAKPVKLEDIPAVFPAADGWLPVGEHREELRTMRTPIEVVTKYGKRIRMPCPACSSGMLFGNCLLWRPFNNQP